MHPLNRFVGLDERREPGIFAAGGLVLIGTGVAIWVLGLDFKLFWVVLVGLSAGQIEAALPNLDAPAGRLEVVSNPQAPYAVLVDFAHTPDALRSAIQAVRPVVGAGGELRVLFGCGGNRDAGKRFKMGAAAAELAESICITTDNPRRENAETIARQVAEGCASVRASGWRMEPATSVSNSRRRDSSRFRLQSKSWS